MVASKKDKQIKRKENPKDKFIAQGGDPEQYYHRYPAWDFSNSDQEKWAFTKDHIGDLIWTEILPKLKSLETQTWKEILLHSKKQNHSIDVHNLNKSAQDRLDELHIEAESLISLHLTGTHRIYGYITKQVFHILWYDDGHGDNKTCVCRSTLKNT